MANPEHLAILRKGVKVWNKWRDENPEIQPDLSGELRNPVQYGKKVSEQKLYQKANLCGINFSNTNFTQARFCLADLRNSNFSHAKFTFANFTEANLSLANLTQAKLISVNLSKTNFIQAKLNDTDLYVKKESYQRFPTSGDLICDDVLDFTKARFLEANFIGAFFHRADFFKANFYKIKLSCNDFKKANFNQANFNQACFNQVEIGAIRINDADFSYADLSKINLSQLKSGIVKDYTIRKVDLSLVKLTGANLSGQNLMEEDLSYKDLSYSNLSNANLTRARLLKTNLKYANLTGACIEDWHTNNKTNLYNVICDYIYLKQNNQERRPSNLIERFNPGDFSNLFQKVLETVDLVFADGINWQAFLYSFQKLQIECDSEKIAIQAIEKKSSGAFVIRVEVPSDANKAKIEKYLENKYQLKLQSLEEKYKLKLGAKDEQIDIFRQHNTDLLEIIKREANRPINSNNSMSNINQFHSGSGDNIGRDKNINNIHESPELTQTIEDIQAVLEKLEQIYNPKTTTGKMTIATKAIEHIEQDRNLSQRVFSALEKGGAAWLQAKLINPSASFLIAALEDWQKNKQ